MSMNKLSGIERELVLQYLIDGNVPVTITPIDDATENEEVPHLSTVVFPVAIKPDNISVLKEGIILLKNPNSSVSNFEGKDVKVEFYFNKRSGVLERCEYITRGVYEVSPNVEEKVRLVILYNKLKKKGRVNKKRFATDEIFYIKNEKEVILKEQYKNYIPVVEL